MVRILYRLTDRIVRSLEKPGYHADGGGLYLQVSKACTKSWVLRYRINRRTRDIGLGALTSVSLSEARARVTELRALIAKGIDPIAQAEAVRATVAPKKHEVPAAPTFRAFAEKYIDDHAPEWRSAKHADQWRATLKQHVYPTLGDMPLWAIETSHILQVLEPIWRTKSETASRVRGRIERILAAASVRGLIFPGLRPGKTLSDMTLSKLVRSMGSRRPFTASVPAACLSYLRERIWSQTPPLLALLATAVTCASINMTNGGESNPK